MTISAATLRKLINAGLSGEALIDIVESIENDMKPVRSSGAERQARYRERLGITAREWATIAESVRRRDAGTCQYCGCRSDGMHVDHVIPLIQGGTNELSNLVCACASCNRTKSGRTPEEWRGARWV